LICDKEKKMKKFFLFLAFCSLFLIVSCGGSSDKDKSTDDTDSGKAVADEDKTDSEPGGDTEQGGDTEPAENPDQDSGDTTPDNGDSTDDGDKTDSGDSQPDGDSGDSTNDADPCESHHCSDLQNSDGQCYAKEDTTYECGCNEGYFWDGASCINPCEGSDLCAESHRLSGSCNAIDVETYTCDCEKNYIWNTEKHDCILDCNQVGGTWDEDEKTCGKTFPCDEKPEGTVWNGETSYTGYWHNGIWEGKSTDKTEYSETPGKCHYVCADGYFRYEYVEGMYIKTKCKQQFNLGNRCTGQKKCYDDSAEFTCPTSSSANFFGQDAQNRDVCTIHSLSSFEASAQNNSDDRIDTVADYYTGLIWEKSLNEETFSWGDAVDYDSANNHCAQLNAKLYQDYYGRYNGKRISNWRLPNPFELLTIYDNGNSSLASPFVATTAGTRLWTSKKVKNSNNAYYFSPYYGTVASEDQSITRQVICVSGKELLPAEAADFELSSDGKAVLDKKTNLVWQKEYSSDKLTWQKALAECQKLNSPTDEGWRLPNKNELFSLVNPNKESAPYSYFPDMPDQVFWSSTTNIVKATAGDTVNTAWQVSFDTGTLRNQQKTSLYYVRCVRNAE